MRHAPTRSVILGTALPTWEDDPVLRWTTAGESHGRALVALVEGMVAGVQVTSADIGGELARRRLGYGRGARMKFEQDVVTVLAGIRHGNTLGGPIAIEIGNSEWPKWETVMAADPVEGDALDTESARNAPLTRPRPGHADYAGMLKYGFDDARPVLERASARETAARVAAGTIARAFLRQALGVDATLFELPAEAKAAVIARERQAGPVMMVGDGINDAPALAAADVGVAMGARGAAASSEAASVVVLVDRLEPLAHAVVIARRTRKIALESVFIGLGLSIVGMLIASTGVLPPVGGALLQEGIDVAVILNALRALR